MAEAVASETLRSNDAGYLLSLTLLLTKIAGIVENTLKVKVPLRIGALSLSRFYLLHRSAVLHNLHK